MPFSQIARSIGTSATLALNAKAAQLRADGEPVVHLGGGEPKSKCPAGAIASGVEMLETGEIRYSPAAGTPAMKDAIIAYTERDYGRRVARTNVVASAGVKQALMVALMALVDPGDEVVFPVPYWVSYPDMTRLCGGVPVPVPPRAGSLQPDLEAIVAAMGPRTRAVLLNSPNNPSGVVYDDEFIREIVRICEERDVYLLMDDIYRRLVFDGGRAVPCTECTDRELDDSRLVVLNGVSKEYAMTGFRIGWAVGPAELIKAMGNIQSHQTGGPSTLAQAAALGAMADETGSVEQLLAALQTGRDEMVSLLRKIPGLDVATPGGTFYCFADFSAFDADSARLSAFLLDKVQVVTVPGIEFGLDGHLRLSFCGSLEDIREGVRRIAWALDADGPAEYEAGGRIFRR